MSRGTPHGSGLVVPGRTQEERIQHRLVNQEHANEESWRAATGWATMSYQSGWSTYDSNYYDAAWMRDSTGRIWLRGLVKNVSYSTATICTLPAGARPGKIHHFSVVAGGGYGQITVQTNGNVQHEIGLVNYLGLAQISFHIGN